MSKKLGLALGSGGARGAAHIGFLQVLEEHNIKPSYISGSSMGALVGACYAAGLGLEYVKEQLFALRSRDILDFDIMPLTKQSIFKSTKLGELISKHLSGKKFEDLQIPFTCMAVNLLDGKEIVLKSGELDKSVTASCSIPVIFRPVEIDGMLLTDGGLSDRVPAGAVKDMGAQVVVACDVVGNCRPPKRMKTLLDVMLRTIDISDHHSTNRKKQLENDIIDLYIDVDMDENISKYNIKHVKDAYQAGLKAGQDNIEKIKKLIK